MATPLAKELKEYSSELSATQFKDYLESQLPKLYPGWTVDKLLVNPEEAINFCNTIRRMKGFEEFPDELILRGLITRRKSPVKRKSESRQ